MRNGWPQVEACFEVQPHFTEAFDAWVVATYDAG